MLFKLLTEVSHGNQWVLLRAHAFHISTNGLLAVYMHVCHSARTCTRIPESQEKTATIDYPARSLFHVSIPLVFVLLLVLPCEHREWYQLRKRMHQDYNLVIDILSRIANCVIVALCKRVYPYFPFNGTNKILPLLPCRNFNT